MSSIDAIEEQALHKISELITKMHAFLLPRTSNTSVYRDLNEDQEHLLENLNSESVIHSILAGCLAIDSCQHNIFQSEEILKTGILKNFLSIINAYQKIEQLLLSQVLQASREKNNVSIYDGFTFMYHYLEQMCSTSLANNKNSHEELLRKIKHSLDEKSLKSITSYEQTGPKIPPLILNKQPKSHEFYELLQQNKKLKEKLQVIENPKNQLQLKFRKNSENKIMPTSSEQNDFQSHHLSNTDHQPQSEIISTSTYQQLKKLNLIINQLKFENRALHKQHYQEKKSLLIQIERLEQQLSLQEKHSDDELILLIEDLEMEIEHLRQQRRNDQRIIMSIQDKFQHMRVSRNMRERVSLRSSRRGPDLNQTANYETNSFRKSLLKQKYSHPQSFRSHEGILYRDPIREHSHLLNPYSETCNPNSNNKLRLQIRTQRSSSQKYYSRFRKNSPKFSTPSELEDLNTKRRLPYKKKNFQIPQNTVQKSTTIKAKVHFDDTFMPQKSRLPNHHMQEGDI